MRKGETQDSKEKKKKRKRGWIWAGGRLYLQHNASSNSIIIILPEQMCKDSIYSLYNMKMKHISISLIRNLGRCCQKVHAASEM